MLFTITKTFRFAAAHHLPRLPVEHKCRTPHGHNYTVTIEVSASELDVRGFVIDYATFDRLKDWLVATFDHQDLNAVVWPHAEAPTAENLAHYIATTATIMGYQWSSVTVNETPNTSATVWRER